MILAGRGLIDFVMNWKLFLLFFGISLNSFSEKVKEANDSITLTGGVKNALNGKTIESARLVCVSEDSLFSKRYVSEVKDFSTVPHMWNIYEYKLKVPHAGKFRLYIESEGYETDSLTIEIPEKQYGRRIREWEMEDIFLVPSRGVTKLGAAVVRASRVMVIMKGDTLVYDASAFKLSEGSMLDALISRLPGAEIDENGRITINGKYVSSLLLNGKDFFKGQTHVVLKNLPAYTVNKIKFYQKEPDDAYLVRSDSSERHTDPWVLDVVLKREYNTGWLANAELGGGTHQRYLARAFALRFTEVSSLMAYAGINNLNRSSTAELDGTWKNPNQNVGRYVNKAGGINFQKENPLTRNKFDLHLSGNYTSSSLEEFSNKTLYLLSPNVFQRIHSQSQNRDANIDANASLQYQWKKMFLYMSMKTTYDRQKNRSFSHDASFGALPEENHWGGALDSIYHGSNAYRLKYAFISRMQELNSVKRETWNFSYYLNTTMRSPFTGNNISLRIDAQHKISNATGRYSYDYENAGFSTNQLHNRPAHDRVSKISTELGYQLLSRKIFKIDLKYNFDAGYTNDRLSIFALQNDTNFISATNWVITTAEVLQPNSYRTSLQNIEHEPALKIFWKLSPKAVLNMTYPVRFIYEKINDVRHATTQTKRRNYVAFEPTIHFDITGSLMFYYHINNHAAQMVNLLDINDDTQPLINRIGNTKLKRPTSHHVMFTWQRGLGKMQRMMSVYYQYNLYINKVSMGLSYDRMSGVSTIKPENVSGDWNMLFQFRMSQALDKSQRLRTSVLLASGYANSVELINNGMSAEPKRRSVRNFEPSLSGTINYSRDKLNMTLRASTSWQYVSHVISTDDNIKGWKYQIGLSAQCPLPLKLTLNSELSVQGRKGYNFSEMNTDDVVLNASLTRAFGKNEKFVAKLYAQDLLGLRKNVSTFVNAQGLTEKWRNILPRYIMLSFIWNFHKTPRQN